MKDIEVKGKNAEEAIEKGLKELNTTIENVDIEILEEGKTGFFNFGNNYVKVKLTLKSEIMDYAELIDLVKGKAQYLLKLMNLNLTVTATIFGGRILLDLTGEDANLIIGRSGEVLDAFEEIINLMISKDQRSRIKVMIDVDNYRKERAGKIKAMLVNVVENILSTGKSYKMRPMTTAERRVVHAFIEKYPELESMSEGQGRDRYIVISKKSKISFE